MVASRQVQWQHGEVVAVDPVAADVAGIVLRVSAPRPAPPGSHVDVRVPAAGAAGAVGALAADGAEVVRSYSIVRSGDEGRELTLCVQLAPASRGGSRFMHELRPGDRVALTQPLQDFPLGVGAARYLLLAGGIGVTALASMAETLRARQADYELHYAGRSRPRMALLDRLRADHGERLHTYAADDGHRLDVDALLDGLVAPGAPATELYLCGPIRLMDAVRHGWRARGLPEPRLRFETFGNSGSWPSEPFVVRVPAVGREVEVAADQSILDALADAGIEVMSDCRKGECGLCAVEILDLDGRIDHRDVFFSEAEHSRDAGLCACVSRVVAPGAAVDHGAAADHGAAVDHGVDPPRGRGSVAIAIP